MEHDEFITEVQTRARLRSRADAERATRAVLETVAEHMSGGAAFQLASRLPEAIGEHVRRRAPHPIYGGQVEGFDTFFARVGEREGVDRATAVFHSRVVIEVAKEAGQARLAERVAGGDGWFPFRLDL